MAVVNGVNTQTGLPQAYLPSKPFEKHRMLTLSRNKVADAANLALFQLQDKTPEEQLAGAALLFAVLCEKTGTDPEAAHTMAQRILRAPDEGDFRTGNNLQALRDFASIFVAGKDTTFW